MRTGSDLAIITCGIMLPRSLQAAEELAAEGISARVINMSSIKPLDEESMSALPTLPRQREKPLLVPVVNS